MINYYCPDFYTGYKFYDMILNIQKDHPELFYEDVHIKTIFGSFPGAIWNGGSIFNTRPVSNKQEMDFYFGLYEKLNIPLQITFTNPFITENQCLDTYCNAILKTFHNGKHSILVSNPILENYIKINYPKYKIDRSVVNTAKDENWMNLLDTQYNRIVLPRRHNNNFQLLENIHSEYRNRIEIICNEDCPANCPRINTHYNAFAKVTLFENPEEECVQCTNLEKANNLFGIKAQDIISYQDIKNIYEKLGYTEFKLTGRSDLIHIIISIVEYMVKPEYQLKLIDFLLHEIL
jgi:hypothetical protein